MIQHFKQLITDNGMQSLFAVVTLCSFVVFVAMAVDLASGWYKAKLRKEAHTSTALSRTVLKLILYQGSLTITCGMDIMIHVSHVWGLLKVPLLEAVPIVTILWAIFLCRIEWLSVREKADEKTKKQMNTEAKLVVDMAEELAKRKGIKIDLNGDGK